MARVKTQLTLKAAADFLKDEPIELLSGEGAGRTATWTEIEVELADDGDTALLDAVEAQLREAGIRPSASPSKVSRALAETGPAENAAGHGTKRRPAWVDAPRTAGDHVLAYEIGRASCRERV